MTILPFFLFFNQHIFILLLYIKKEAREILHLRLAYIVYGLMTKLGFFFKLWRPSIKRTVPDLARMTTE